MNPKVNAKQLHIFQEVIRSGSISKAARRLGLTQPAVSTAIANLESDMGFMLFRRNHYGTEMTAEAKSFSEGVERALKALNNLEELASDLKHGRTGKLQIGCMPGMATLAPAMVAAFMGHNPGVKLSLQTFPSGKVEEWVAGGHFDLGIVEKPQAKNELEIWPYRFRMLCALPAGSPLAERREITIDDLEGRPLITLGDGHQSTMQLRSLAHRHNLALNVVAETQLFPSAMGLVDAGVGYTLIDPITAMEYGKRHDCSVVLRPFAPRVEFEVAIILPRFHLTSRLCQRFHAALKAEFDAMAARFASAGQEAERN
ncbi:LysR family transcriptional regulator [Oceanimonas pelagia]|uniref:LysR family transcriptional regulator n=1 Tax=Oceanimonas pelagia TaxID=3028314 RepID=A0AA50KRF7_9GAMM|nr:LysR family transcriptional regulator [Oceanimonas pelagia]WMC11597.1 LysR family transcriptional regulator [Oceanimonas pelagia]